MAGPYINPKSAAQESAGANQSGGSPVDFMNKVAKGFMGAGGASPKASISDDSDISVDPAPQSPEEHMMAMQQKAEAAAQAHMAEHGVDRNGNPVVK